MIGRGIGGRMRGWLAGAVRGVEEWWFDWSRHVKTAGNASFRATGDAVGAAAGDGEIYVPARAANGRAALAEAPVRERSAYTLIDLGSGKGRMLFVAAEMGFGQVIGVEFSRSLQEQALQNIAQFRGPKAEQIESVLADAATFLFPPGNLVVYLFNPFGAATMGRVLGNLTRALTEEPRHAVVVLLWPETEALVAATPGMRLVRSTRRHAIYEAGWEFAR